MNWTYRPSLALFALGLFAIVGVACVTPNLPPPMSMSKFVHTPAAQGTRTGSVGASTGVTIIGAEKDDKKELDGNFFFFPIEAQLAMSLHQMYDAAVAINNGGMLGLEGNLNLLVTPTFRLGIVHGFGMGFGGELHTNRGEWDGLLHYAFTIGVLGQFQLGGLGTFFLGSKYTFSHLEDLGDDPDGDEPMTHYVTTSLGFAIPFGALRVVPEFIFSYGGYQPEDAGGGPKTTDLWIISPSISVAASF